MPSLNLSPPIPPGVRFTETGETKAGQPATDDHDPLTEDDIRACLALIDENGQYETWRDVGAAIHHWDPGAAGLALFDEWSRSGRYESRSAVVRQWQGFRGMKRISVASLLWRARQVDPNFVPPSWAKPPEPTIPEFVLRHREKIARQVRESHAAHAAHLARQEEEAAARAEEETTKPKPRRFRMLTSSEAANLPPPNYLVPGLIVTKSIGCICGPSGSFKSFLSLHIGLSLAHGLPWCGYDLSLTPVCYVAEGAHGLGVRIAAWERHHGLKNVSAPFRLIAEGLNLMDPQCMADLTEEIEAEAMAIGQPFGLIVLDTLATCAVGMEEFWQRIWIALGRMSAMRHTLGCSVFAVHHTGKDADRGMRGSYRLKGDFDTVFQWAARKAGCT
ncbi:AAA family ATPase [Siccirubricoccus deserti]